jgi:hypothetical protein
VKYAFVKNHHEIFTANRMCQLLDVSQSACYDWLKRPESVRSLEDKRLGEKVRESYEKSRKIYGARRIVKDFVDDNEVISRNRVARLMKQQGLEMQKVSKVG